MKNFKYISIVLVALLALVGCKETMRELNTNSDLVDDTQVSYMFTGATQNFDFSGSTTDNFYAEVHQLMQYIVYQSLSNDMYRNPDLSGAVSPRYIDGVCYSELFSNSKGNRLQSILDYIGMMNDEKDALRYADVEAFCEGLIAYMQWRILENYGATVYSQAFGAITLGITQPEYEYIEDLYKEIDQTLANCVKQLSGAEPENVFKLGKSDFFAGWKSTMKEGRGLTYAAVSDYSQVRASWMRFFNVLRLQIAYQCRLAAGGDFFDKVFNECNAVPNGYMTNVDEGFYFHYAHNYGTMDDAQEGEQNYVMSESFLNALKYKEDPRLPYLARPNGATEFTSPSYQVMRDYFPDSLKKYGFFDGKHPYMGVTPNISLSGKSMVKASDQEEDFFITNKSYIFNDVPNPKYPKEFVIKDSITGDSISFCDAGKEKMSSVEILIASQTQYRYWIVCGGNHEADHSYHGNGLYALGDKQYSRRYHSDGDTPDQTGAVDLAIRCRVFTYPKQCFLFALIAQETGKNFAGKDASAWYNDAVKAAFAELEGEACRVGIQAYTGGDHFGSTDKTYPKSLTQVVGDPSSPKEVTYNFPYRYPAGAIDTYLAANQYSKENLNDQMYLYGYLDPYASFIWWRMTGYPKVIKHATAKEAASEPHTYLEMPTITDTQNKLIPRRGCLPDQTALNYNFQDAKSHLLQMQGFKDWNETEGCIWWEYPYSQQN